MSRAVRFTIPGEPKGKQRPRATVIGGHARMYTPKQTVTYEAVVAGEAARAMDGRPPITGPVGMCITAYFPIPSSFSRKKRELALSGALRPGKIDLDNIAKSIGDGAQGVAFANDRDVVRLLAQKFYADHPRVDVIVEAIGSAA